MTIATLPQWEWVLVASNITAVTVNSLSTGFKAFFTIRETGEEAPDVIVNKEKPSEAVNLFNKHPSEAVFESQARVDFYMFCYSMDNRVETAGQFLIKEGVGNSLPANPNNGGLDVNVQDQTTPAVIQKFNQVTNSTTLTAPVVLYSYTITVASNAGIVLGSHLVLFSPDLVRFTSVDVIGISGNVITVDSQLDAAYPAGTFVDVTFTNMAVNGSGTPQVFGLRGLGTPEGVELTVDITRVIMTCYTDSPVSLALFGDLPKLLRGLLLRNRNGETFNIFNVKSNGEIAGITLDWFPYDKSKPNEGQDGFTARLTFAGQARLGVAERLKIGQDLEFVVQDDLLLLDSLEIVAEGHVVD